MRFLTRSISGIAIFAATIFVLFLGARPYLGCAPGLDGVLGARCVLEQEGGARRRGGEERVYAVRLETARLERVQPVIEAFGEIRSGRTLEVRPAASGRLVETADAFREGGRVAEDETLFVVDPADPQARRDEAAALLDEARSQRLAAKRSAELAETALAASVNQRDLRKRALERQQSLRERGVSTDATLEEAELALADAERAVISAETTLDAEMRRAEQAELAVSRAEIALSDAERALRDTVFTAPFDGFLLDVTATLGRLVSANEQLGSLIDPGAIEVGFRVSDGDFARLLDAQNRLTPLPVTATLDLGPREITVEGRVDRVAATNDLTSGGRLVFAALDLPEESVLRPGDFVSVKVIEPALEQVARLPAAAVDASNRVLTLGDDGRLKAIEVAVLRRQGDMVLARGPLDGVAVVVERGPQLGAGVKARQMTPEGAPQEGAPAETGAAEESVSLDPERRARLVELVETSRRMSAERRETVLAQLNADETPKALVDRLEARLARRADRSGAGAGSN